MAIISGSVIGEFRGRLGKLSARINQGRTILSQRPSSFHANNSPVMVEIRKRFAVTISFVKSLLTLSALNEIWLKTKTGKMTVYNYVFRKNFPQSSTDKPTVDNRLTPDGGFPLSVTSADVTADAVTIQLPSLESIMILTQDEREITPNVVLCYYNPTNPEDAPYAVVPVKAASEVIDPLNPLTLNVPLNVIQKGIAAKYQNSILYLALTTTDKDGNLVQYSSTYTQED